MITDSDAIHPYLEDSAHTPGGHTPGVYRPKDEAEIVEIVKRHHASGQPLLPQGARTSLTGGATPLGETVLSLENLNQILNIEKTEAGAGRAVVQPYVRLNELIQEANKLGLYYPPTPTYDLATLGGTVATCAAGSATFKYGTTRNWVHALRLVLANGDILSIKRGDCQLDANHTFETRTVSGKTLRFQVPTSYQTPTHLKKVSCGYYVTPHMDLVDFFIGSEGTLGIVTEIEVELIPKPTTVLNGLAFFHSEEQAFEFVQKGRELAIATWQKQGNLNLRAMEFLDATCLKLLKEKKKPKELKVPLPAQEATAIYFEIELEDKIESTELMERLEKYLELTHSGRSDEAPVHPVEVLFQLLYRYGALNPEELVLAFPEDEEMIQRIWKMRESVPEIINDHISRLKGKHPNLTKVACDVIVPFERIPEMIHIFRDAAARHQLKIALFGHISDGNLHPNILVSGPQDVHHGEVALREGVEEILKLGGAPMSEHGVGRNPLRQGFLSLFYGEKALQEMAQTKLALDPRGILSPGVIFPKSMLKLTPVTPTIQEGAKMQNVGDEEGKLWHFSLKSLTKAQDFVNGFLARFLAQNKSAQELMARLKKIGHKTSGYLTDYIAIPYSAERIRELKRRGFVRDLSENQIVFRHFEGIFPPFLIRPQTKEPIDEKVLNEEIPVEYEFDEEDIWVPLEEVWAYLPTLEDNYAEVAQQPFPFLKNSEISQMEVGWRVGELSRFGFSSDEIKGGPLYRQAAVPKTNKKEPPFVLVERVIGIYSGFETGNFAPKLSPFFHLRYQVAKSFYQLGREMFIFFFGMERLAQLLIGFVGPKWARRILNEVHDGEWLRDTPKGIKDKEQVEAILGKRGWEIFVDHRTIRRSLMAHLSLWDRLLWLIGLGPKKPMGQNEVSYRILTFLETEKHEDYTPTNVSDWKARVMRDRDVTHRKTRSQIAYFLDESLPEKRGNIATFATFWGATTGWPFFDFVLALLHFDWGPDPWYFHHIAIEGNFDLLAKAVQDPSEDKTQFVTPDQKIKDAKEVGFLDRFSFMWFLRQVFSKERRWVPCRRLQALYLAGRLTQQEFKKYVETLKNGKVIVEGPHMEIIDRRSGIPWFNQVRVTQAIDTSSEVKVKALGDQPQDVFEPWHQRIKLLFGSRN